MEPCWSALISTAYLPVVHVTLAILAGIVFGALWAGIAGLLKLIFGSNELINTMMLNYIAILFVEFLIHGPIKPPDSYLYVSAEVLPSAKLPIILSKTPLHLGFIISLFVVAGVFLPYVPHTDRISDAHPSVPSSGGLLCGH